MIAPFAFSWADARLNLDGHRRGIAILARNSDWWTAQIGGLLRLVDWPGWWTAKGASNSALRRHRTPRSANLSVSVTPSADEHRFVIAVQRVPFQVEIEVQQRTGSRYQASEERRENTKLAQNLPIFSAVFPLMTP